MAALLQYFQALLGRRGFFVALVIVALGAFAIEYSSAITAYFNAYIQSQVADVAEKKAAGEADKAAEDARSAKAAADNATALRLAEAQERAALAQKAAADAEAAAAVARNSAVLQEGLARKAQEEADNLRQKNKMLRSYTDGSRDGDLRDEMMDLLGFRKSPAARQQEADAPANQPQVPPKCRQPFANWQGYTFHAAFALTDDGDCVWSSA